MNNKKIPNKTTLKAIQDTEAGKNLVKAETLEDLFKKLGIWSEEDKKIPQNLINPENN